MVQVLTIEHPSKHIQTWELLKYLREELYIGRERCCYYGNKDVRGYYDLTRIVKESKINLDLFTYRELSFIFLPQLGLHSLFSSIRDNLSKYDSFFIEYSNSYFSEDCDYKSFEKFICHISIDYDKKIFLSYGQEEI